jgi:hypothetical protein
VQRSRNEELDAVEAGEREDEVNLQRDLSSNCLPERPSELTIAQSVYRDCGYLIIAARFRKEIGAPTELEDGYLFASKWRVTAEATREQMEAQLREFERAGAARVGWDILERPFFYRVEAMD